MCSRPCIKATVDHRPDAFRWITLKKIEWEDINGRIRFWEAAERTTRSSSGVDGVAIIARLHFAASAPQIAIISQYRPPIGCYCLELPAGLVDEGETVGSAALRELREETGLTGRLALVTPLCVNDPGMTNANMQAVLVEVDGDAPENIDAEQHMDEGESIEVALAPWDGLLSWLLEQKAMRDCHIDARLLHLALGLHLGELGLGLGLPGPPPLTAANDTPASKLESMQDSRPFGSPVMTVNEQKLIDLKESNAIFSQSESNDNKTTASSLHPENLNWYVAAFEDNPQESSSARTLMQGSPLAELPSEGVSRAGISDLKHSAGGPIFKRVIKMVCDGKYLAGVATATALALILKR